MSIALKNAVKIVTDAVTIINRRFPIKWEDIANKPTISTIDVTDFYTKEEVDKILKNSNQLISQDGTVWKPTIDNNGTVIWKKVMPNGK
ncbi:prophage P2a protein 51 [Lactiplantibacillus plantarum]|nr:prophage P2a protein 51 [Lactiplantibacillus plantarum]MCG0624830.1 prophage P2a protein 51 [Lactiplantibacillus plantarum]MCG0751837.1 prophage P2a protein 51 [Lactiplantibacillus plantarum]MCG0761034.1 prophage P2a protein 51 [Lactiplantibacillus plantarum]MCG0888133.1 prophage P2a protein 51 [Lactiplantibacillus plantarum]